MGFAKRKRNVKFWESSLSDRFLDASRCNKREGSYKRVSDYDTRLVTEGAEVRRLYEPSPQLIIIFIDPVV